MGKTGGREAGKAWEGGERGKGGEGQKERTLIFLIYSQMVTTTRAFSDQSLGPGTSIQISKVGGRAPSTQSASAASASTFKRSWVGNKAARTRIGPATGCRCCRLGLKLSPTMTDWRMNVYEPDFCPCGVQAAGVQQDLHSPSLGNKGLTILHWVHRSLFPLHNIPISSLNFSPELLLFTCCGHSEMSTARGSTCSI